jgi:phosphoserine aminotransferase
MISFYPGPSRVYDEIPKYVQDAARLGVMSINHRSEEFIAISKKTIALLQH